MSRVAVCCGLPRCIHDKSPAPMSELLRVGDALARAAMTTGGTAGRDEDLVRAVAEWITATAPLKENAA